LSATKVLMLTIVIDDSNKNAFYSVVEFSDP